MVPQLLINTHDLCGENPLWDERRQQLFWCDIPHGEIYVYNPATLTHRLVFQGPECGAFTLQEDGKLLLLLNGAMALLDPDTGVLGPQMGGLTQNTGRFNDCIATPQGQVYVGSTDFADQKLRGGIHHLSGDGTMTELWRGTNCSNGWGFSPTLDALYFCDTTARHILKYPLDASLRLGQPVPLLHTPEHMPDGFTMDLAGNLWVAFWDLACVRLYSPAGALLQQVDIPSKNVTSCAFGGTNYRDLYVTSAGGEDNGTDGSGGLYRFTPALGGRPEWRSTIAW